MKNINKLFILIISIFVLAFGAITIFADENQAVLSSTSFEVHEDEEFTTTLYIPDEANIVDFDITLKYDTDLVSLVGIEENEDCKGDITYNSSTPGTIKINYTRTSKNVTEYLPLLDITIKTDANIGVGNYDLFTPDEGSAFVAHTLKANGALQEVDFNVDFANLNIYEMGDVDLSGGVNIGDATIIRRYLAKLDGATLSDFAVSLADTYYDGEVKINDAANLQRHLAGITEDFYGKRVNVTFYDGDGEVYAVKSVLFDGTLSKIPNVPTKEGYTEGAWSTNPSYMEEPTYSNLQDELKVYAYYDTKAPTEAMDYYKQLLTDLYYDGDLKTGLSSDLYLRSTLDYQEGYYASLAWSSDSNYVLNSTTGKFTQPTYPQKLNLTAKIVSYDSVGRIESKGSITFCYDVAGRFSTPTYEEVRDWVYGYFTDSETEKYLVNYDVKLVNKITNEDISTESSDSYEIRFDWYQDVDGKLEPLSQIKRTTAAQNNDYVAVATFNGKPLGDGDGKIYVDDVDVTAIDQLEIKNFIINQIAANQGTIATDNISLWNDDTVYGTHVTWTSGNADIAYVENNVIKLKQDAVSGSVLPLNAEVSYSIGDKTDSFILSYNLTVSCDNTRIKYPENMDESLYKALKTELEEELGYRGDLTSEALGSVKFVNLDLSDYPDITSLRGLSYCTYLRTLNISGLHITDGTMNQIATLSYLEAFVARDCGLDNLTDGGSATLRNATGLKLLDLTNNNFTSLDSVFAEGVKYGKLREVYLSNNQLKDINALSRAPIMTYLSLSGNGLTTEGIKAVANYTFLTYLSLADNEIDSVNDLQSLRYLKELRLQNNNISEVKALRRLVNLEALYIGHNNIKDVSLLNNLTSLKILYANDNEIYSISELTDLTKLEAVNFSNNNISTLSVLKDYKGTLTEIYAENNNVSDFSFINGATKLHILMLAGNATEKAQKNMSSWLTDLTGLEILTLSDIRLSDLAFLEGMEKLVRLDVDNCGLQALNGDESNLELIGNLYSTLRVLNISNNDFSGYEDEILEIGNDTLLTVFYADNICDSLDAYDLTYSMPELKYISMENNGITTMNWLKKYTSLKYVNLAGNNISSVDFSLHLSTASRKTIEELYLDTNADCTFANAITISDFYNLKKLSLEGVYIGKIEKLPRYLESEDGKSGIEYLNISNTGITDLTKGDEELNDIFPIETYKATLKTLDISGLDVDLDVIKDKLDLDTLYVVGNHDSKIFSVKNLRILESLYNDGVDIYLYDKETKYAPDAQKEGAVILGNLEDYSCDIMVGADGVISDNNPDLPLTVLNSELSWDVNSVVDVSKYPIVGLPNTGTLPTAEAATCNYKIDVDDEKAKLAVSDYTDIDDEELTVTAGVKVYESQNAATRDFTFNTDILRVSDFAVVTEIKPVVIDTPSEPEESSSESSVEETSPIETSSEETSSSAEESSPVEESSSSVAETSSLTPEEESQSIAESISAAAESMSRAIAESSSSIAESSKNAETSTETSSETESSSEQQEPEEEEVVIFSREVTCLENDSTGLDDYMARSATFTYKISIKAASHDGFSTAVKPVVDDIKYSFTTKLSNGETGNWSNTIKDNGDGTYTIKDEAPLDSTTTITVQIGHYIDEEFIADETMQRAFILSARTNKITYETNGGTIIRKADGSVLSPAEQNLPEDTVLFETINLVRPGYIFDGWYLDAEFTELFSKSIDGTSKDAQGNDVYTTMPAEDITIYAKWIPYNYNIYFDANGGTLETTSMNSLCGTAIGTMPTPEKAGYNFVGWYTSLDESGTKVDENTVIETADDLNLIAKWEAKTFEITFDANEGSATKSTMSVTYDATYGELPEAVRDYYTFTGWFTAKVGGTEVKAEDICQLTEDVTLYAQWEENAVSDWVLASEVPAGAQTVNQKWSYTQRTNTESTATSLAGYTQYGSEWVKSSSGSQYWAYFPSNYNTSDWRYQQWGKSPVASYEKATTKRNTSYKWAGYIYYHWAYPLASYTGAPLGRVIGSYYNEWISGCGYATRWNAFTTTNGASKYYDVYVYNTGVGTDVSTYWWRTDYYISYYDDYVKNFFYYKEETKWATDTKPTTSSTIYNVKEYVQYRPQ